MAKSSKLLQDALAAVLQKHQLKQEDVAVTIVSVFKWGNRCLLCFWLATYPNSVEDVVLARKTILQGLTFIVIFSCSLMSDYLGGWLFAKRHYMFLTIV